MADLWKPTASLEMLKFRAQLTSKIRSFFHERSFLEIETPLLSRDTVVDVHLDPLQVTLPSDPRRPADGRPMYLQTSPEFAMKRLLAAGATAIFQICKSFRAAESGSNHNPEFTMVEWYRAGDDDHAGIELLSDLVDNVLGRGQAQVVTYQHLFQSHIQIDPRTCDGKDLFDYCQTNQIDLPASFSANDRDALLDLLMSLVIQPSLGLKRPTIVKDYPASQAALAKLDPANSSIAKRFELFVDGAELANGYDELLDWQVLLERNQNNNQARSVLGKPQLPEQSRLIEAMQSGLPPSSGCALGLDRLVMVAAGVESIDQVIPFPIDRA